MKPRFSLPWIVWLSAVITVSALPDVARGQRARLGSNSLGSNLVVGRTAVSDGSYLQQEGRRSLYGGGGVSGGNFVQQGAGAGRNPFGAGLRTPMYHNPLAPFARPPIGVYNAFANPLSYQMARQRAPVTRNYTGRESWSRARSTRFGADYRQGTAYMALQNSQALLHRYSFFGPVRAATKGGRIRDELTNTTLQNMPDAVEARLDDSVPRQSFSEIMENRLIAERNERIALGWEQFMRGRYRIASGRFQCAAVRRNTDPEPKVGILLSEIAARQKGTARVVAQQLIPDLVDRQRPMLPDSSDQMPNPFACDINLRDLAAKADKLESETPEVEDEVLAELLEPPEPWSTDHLDGLLRDLAIEVEQDPQPETLALRVFLLWYAGDRREAIRVAENLRRAHRKSQFARMIDQINEVMAEERTPSGQAHATP